ncbi:MAG: SLBB domain-containing protein [Pseudomonadota bacterium]
MVSWKSFLSGILLTVAVAVLGSPAAANAQNMPSQAQMEQLKSLPRAQQEALARQFGIDPSMLDNLDQMGMNQQQQGQDGQQENIVFPRGTEFDSEGDPVIPKNLENQFIREEDQIKPFGYDFFAGEPRSFNPTNYAPVPANYLLGVGDKLTVQLFGKENKKHELEVSREGSVTIPGLNPLQVAGLTYQLAQEYIRNQVSDRMIGVQAAVSLGELRSIQVVLAGEAYKPGTYTISALSTLTQALYLAGGMSDIASLRSIRLMRAGEVISDFDLYDLLLEGDASADRMLQSGDVIFIPARGEMVTVKGEVKRPAIYELKGDETLEDVLAFAGGSADDAYLQSVQLQRVRDGKRVISTLDLTEQSDLALQVRGGDVLSLQAVSESLDDSILLVGAVSRPGNYEWREGMQINDVLRRTRHDLLEQADLDYGLIVREKNRQGDLSLLQFNVAEAIAGVEGENHVLKDRDQLVIFSRYQTKTEEKQQLSRFTLTEQEREQEEREKLLKEYRMAFLQDLVNEKLTDEEEEQARRQNTQAAPLSELFGSPDEEDVEVEESELALYSRDKLLEPIMQKLQRQRSYEGSTPLVYIAGEVNHPGVYPLTENATVSRLVDAGGGVKDSAYLKRAEITRFNFADETAQTEYINVPLKEVLAGELDKPIEGRDRLNVLSIPEWQNTYEVTLNGEVRFPGTYAIKRGETLTKLIDRAGGFTDHAFIEGAVFTREELRKQEKERKKLLAQELQREVAGNMLTGTGESRVSYNEMRTLLADLLAAEPVGRLIMDLPEVLKHGGSYDIQLKDGDTLHVPSRSDSVSILGEVQMATSYRYNPDLSVEEYISRSGGLKEKADEERIYIVKANGTIHPYEGSSSWFGFSGGTHLGPGDAIVVPMDTTYTENLELWSQVTTILYNTAVAVAAINGI